MKPDHFCKATSTVCIECEHCIRSLENAGVLVQCVEHDFEMSIAEAEDSVCSDWEEETDAEKLNKLADWFDLFDTDDSIETMGNSGVQKDLRRIAADLVKKDERIAELESALRVLQSRARPDVLLVRRSY